MEQDLTTVLREIAEMLRARGEDDRAFRERLLEELRHLNRTMERLYDQQAGGPI